MTCASCGDKKSPRYHLIIEGRAGLMVLCEECHQKANPTQVPRSYEDFEDVGDAQRFVGRGPDG